MISLIDFLRAFCFVACLLTGIYYAVLYRHQSIITETIWFHIMCIVQCVFANFTLSMYPGRFFYDNTSSSLIVNLFMISAALETLCLSMYEDTYILPNPPQLSALFNGITMGLAILGLIVPRRYSHPVFFLIVAAAVYTDIYGIIVSIKRMRRGDKHYLFSVIAFSLNTAAYIPDFYSVLFHKNWLCVHTLLIPIFLGLNLILLAMQYRESTERVRKLSASLSETITRIKHSENALQCTQMKSEFLNETLDFIQEKCDSDPFTAEDLTINLSKYLRHTLNFQQLKGSVPLDNELELTRAYIAIEKEKHPTIDFKIKVPTPLPDIDVPALSIQPLVENALEHGVINMKQDGKITITITPYRDYCHIDVSDNGAGIPPEILSTLPDSYANSARVGLFSIHNRLVNLFSTGLVLQSEPEFGTSVSFVVPPHSKTRE